MTPNEITKKIRKLQIYTEKRVNNAFSGEYRSIFKGRGMEFDEAREYQPGDDVRSIDWNITARQGTPYIKRFREERQLTVILALDFSASSNFGSQKRQKNELIAEVCALLAFSAIKNNDMVGMLIFTDQVERFIPPGKGSLHVLRLIREILTFEPQHSGSNAKEPMGYLSRVLHRKSIIFLLSDFIDDSFKEDRALFSMAHRHDLVAISVTDPLEKQIPNAGLITFQDAETGEIMTCDTSSKEVREAIQKEIFIHYKELYQIFSRAGIDIVEMLTDHDYMDLLQRFFRIRERRMSNG